ncbi:UvrD-helicase domain-containing protein [Brevibacterium sp. NPDC049920]|uniref:DNA helicase n=1 Tax=Brevibacterium pityocampae TaxID=506594 RepID=A0ABP8JSJ0_9MICO|nr:UvrD-helicase domain-containing protein [uncultured Brevibacterium sp.]
MAEEPRIEEAVEIVLAALPCSVTLPAGAGKTELIAAAVAEVARRGGSCLVLTHTHAGVDALRRRMQKFGVLSGPVLVRTLDSWAYDLIAHFPDLSGLVVPPAPDWDMSDEYHRAAACAARSRAVGRMLKVSYTHLFVDEYQDCLVDQHELVLALATSIPTAVFGDPLQSLFNFGANQPVDWDSDVIPNFPGTEVAYRPRRWDPNHQALGAWLVSVREQLVHGMPINLASAPVKWVERRHARTHVQTCYSALKLEGTVAVLGHQRWDCVNAAGTLGGNYSVMEALDEKIPVKLAEKIDTKGGAEIAQALVKFAIDCSSGLAKHITSTKRKQLGEGKSFTTRSAELMPAYQAVLQVRSDPQPRFVRIALERLGELPQVTIHCREAWREVLRAVTVAATEDCTVADALQRTRNHTRAVGRRPSARVVSRPLLVKGLEYDHVIILSPEKYSAQELYVALTRGSKSVAVISDTVVLPAAKMATRMDMPAGN